MNNKEILERAIQKAIDGGWKLANLTVDMPEKVLGWIAYPVSPSDIHASMFIFDRDFAKALWGEEVIDVSILVSPNPKLQQFMPTYEWHLYQMVIADDPIQYLGENIV